jgi:hypothetical protein
MNRGWFRAPTAAAPGRSLLLSTTCRAHYRRWKSTVRHAAGLEKSGNDKWGGSFPPDNQTSSEDQEDERSPFLLATADHNPMTVIGGVRKLRRTVGILSSLAWFGEPIRSERTECVNSTAHRYEGVRMPILPLGISFWLSSC